MTLVRDEECACVLRIGCRKGVTVTKTLVLAKESPDGFCREQESVVMRSEHCLPL